MVKKNLAKVLDIQSLENLHIVCLDIGDSVLKMLTLELEDSMEVGKAVSLSIKPTSVAIAKDFEGMMSCANQIEATVIEVHDGVLLSSVLLALGDIEIESIITREASKTMNLSLGDSVIALIQESDVMIYEDL